MPLWVVPYLCAAVVVLAAAPLADVIAPYDATRQSLSLRLTPPGFLPGGSRSYLLGTDGLGRDVLSRVLFGLRASLLIGIIGMVIGGTIGSAVGIVAGYKGGYAGCQLRIAPSLEYMDRAWDDAKYGRWSQGPVVWGLTPSVADPDLAPPGRHVMSLNIYHAPYDLREGDWKTERERFGRRCIDVMTEYIPNLKDIMVDCRFWSPRDIEEELGLVEASITHGDMVPGRMFSLRPLPGWSDYRTPLRGLYLCGSGTWPGGFVSGIPGHNAGHQVLHDLREGIDTVYRRIMREGRPGV